MKIPNPQSDDWFFWDPRTIHNYPLDCDSGEESANSSPTLEDKDQARVRVSAGLWREFMLSFVSGIIAAVVLSIVVLLFPSTTRAQSYGELLDHNPRELVYSSIERLDET